MPRVGSREWNRQQNLRRQRQEEQVVQAQIVVQHADQVVLQAEPMECRQDILKLREQLQNKITQIEQLKTNTKEFKKKIKEQKKENDKLLAGESRLIKDINDDGYFSKVEGANKGYFNSKFKFALCEIDIQRVEGIDKENFELWKKKHPETTQKTAFSFGLTNAHSSEKKITTKYIKYLETLIMSSSDIMEVIGTGHNFKEFCDDDDEDKFLEKITTNGNFCKKVEYPECVICGDTCECQYGNNPQPVKDTGKCCNKCNASVVIPARMMERM
tara:strand:+ start:892 stop:1707 length:816 start_codon:yes stop_codon:yes gene_type:complete